MRHYCFFFVICIEFLSFQAIAKIPQDLILTANVGAAKLSNTDSTFAVSPIETDSLVQTENPYFTQFGVGIGYEFPLKNAMSSHGIKWFTAIRPALTFYHFSNQMEGNGYQFQLPQFNNYKYFLGVNSNRLMLDAYLTLAAFKRSKLFIIGGIGGGWTDVEYHDAPSQLNVSNGQITLNNHSNSGFADEIGAGISFELQKNIEVFLQYLYTHYQSIKTSGQGTVFVYPGETNSISVAPAAFPLNVQYISFGFNLKLKD